MQWAELNSTGLYFTVLASGSVRLIKSEPLSLRLDMTRLDWTSVVGAGGTIQYNTTHSSSPLILILMPVMGYREFLLFTSILSCNAPVWLHQEEQRREKKGREEGVNTFERTEQNRVEQKHHLLSETKERSRTGRDDTSSHHISFVFYLQYHIIVCTQLLRLSALCFMSVRILIHPCILSYLQSPSLCSPILLDSIGEERKGKRRENRRA